MATLWCSHLPPHLLGTFAIASPQGFEPCYKSQVTPTLCILEQYLTSDWYTREVHSNGEQASQLLINVSTWG